VKVVHKIILAGAFHVFGIAGLCFFVYQTLDLMLAKMRFLVIPERNFKKVEGNYTGDQTLSTCPS
jgi:hypothetical protein